MNRQLWLLPEGIDELLPAEAMRVEHLRRQMLDHFATWGYELIVTPMIEYLESLLTGTGKDLDLQTFKITDQLTGRQLGFRADITPQAARIDAHLLNVDHPARLCYAGTVLRAQAQGLGASRSPMQIGAELFGHAGIESDIEVLSLLLSALQLSGLQNFHLDLGHVEIFRALAEESGLTSEQENAFFQALQRKALSEIPSLLASFDLDATHVACLGALAELNGEVDVLPLARERLACAPGAVLDALDDLEKIIEVLSRLYPQVPVRIDLGELRAYHYQTGVVFAAFVPGMGEDIARGGRYDHIGEDFGRARPATGFSADLKIITNLAKAGEAESVQRVFVASDLLDQAEAEVARLRAQGKIVLCALPGQTGAASEMNCSHRLEKSAGGWSLAAI